LKKELEQIDEVEDESASKYDRKSSMPNDLQQDSSGNNREKNYTMNLQKIQNQGKDQTSEPCHKFIQTMGSKSLDAPVENEILETEERGIIETEQDEPTENKINPHTNTDEKIENSQKITKTSPLHSKKHSPESSEGTGLKSTGLGTKNGGLTSRQAENNPDSEFAQKHIFTFQSEDEETKRKKLEQPKYAIQLVTISDTDIKQEDKSKAALNISVEEFVNDEESGLHKNQPGNKSDRDSFSEIKADESARNTVEYASRVRTLQQIYDANPEKQLQKHLK
jgi:hypothetical protein